MKLDIHKSCFNDLALAIVRIVSLVAMSLRFFIYLGNNQSLSAYDFKYLTFYGFMITWIYFTCIVVDLILTRLIFKGDSKPKRIIG